VRLTVTETAFDQAAEHSFQLRLTVGLTFALVFLSHGTSHFLVVK